MSVLPNNHQDVVVVGAGIQGLVAAKTYLQLSPNISLLILESGRTIGGVWAEGNIYPGLKTNNQLGTFEFTDFDIQQICPGRVHQGQHIDGDVVYDYFYRYAEHFDLIKHIQLECKVTTAEHLQEPTGGWKLAVVSTNQDPHDLQPAIITTSKLIVCTGLTSSPMPISLTGASSFTPPLFTFHDFQRSGYSLVTNPKIKHIAIYGGAKAAYDTVYAFANSSTPTHPKRITWIIRESGHGPNYMANSHVQMGPLRVWLEPLATTRLLTFFSPCIWGARDGFGFVRRLLHGTRVGRWIINQFWNKLQGDVITQTGLRSKGPEVEKLIPKERMLWYGTGISILNYEKDIHSFLHDGTVKVVRKDIERLDGEKIIFKKSDGSDTGQQHNAQIDKKANLSDENETIEPDALITTTGWRWDSNISFLPHSQHFDLGIPSTHHTPSQLSLSASLNARADAEILSRFPMLAHGPKSAEQEKQEDDLIVTSSSSGDMKEPTKQHLNAHTPWRLFRGIAPPHNPAHDLVFTGKISSFQTFLLSEISALWAYAYLNDELSTPLAPLTELPVPTTNLSPPEKDNEYEREEQEM
ncbi:MAG: hypothetical protein Q9222_007378, partial [Ikaeria aurantiellina]